MSVDGEAHSLVMMGYLICLLLCGNSSGWSCLRSAASIILTGNVLYLELQHAIYNYITYFWRENFDVKTYFASIVAMCLPEATRVALCS